MSVFYGYTNDSVTEEDVHTHLNSKLSISRVSSYDGLTESFKYPSHAKLGYPTSVMFVVNPSYKARVTIVGVHIDNDGGGLGDGDSLEFSIRYITVADGSSTKVTKSVKMFHVDLGDYTKFSLYDGQGVIHCFSILKPYVLSENISNYKDIKTISIGVGQSKGTQHGNETTLVASYDDVLS